MSWEDSFQSWAKAPGQTEQSKCDNAVAAIRKAKDAWLALANRGVSVFAQGSYANRTNVRQDSDVDVCMLCSDTFFYDLPPGKTTSNFNLITPPDYGYSQFKNDVGAALTSYFSSGHVVRGNKAFDIHENTYRISADVVPCFPYRSYLDNSGWLEGVAFLPDNGGRIVNWPEQNYDNGVRRNNETGQGFKGAVRILKTLRYKMNDEKVAAAAPIPSFLLESLCWNVPMNTFILPTYTAVMRETLVYLFNNTIKFEDCMGWREINGIKDLFLGGQSWTCQQVNAFIWAAWNYIGFE